MGKLHNFLALDRTDRRLSLEALALLAWCNVLVRSVPPRLWRSRFGLSQNPHLVNPGADLATIRRIRLAVARAQRTLPSAPNCLPQALAARHMLKRRGIAAALTIGSERDPGGAPRFHAWLKVGDEWVTGHCDEGRYAVFASGGRQPA